MIVVVWVVFYLHFVMDYTKCKTNMASWLNLLPKTNVKFLFFFAGNLDKPKVLDVVRMWECNQKPLFVVPGFQDNYIYLYEESVLKYVVNVKEIFRTKPVTIYNATISGDNGDTNLGNHMDFTIIRLRTGQVVAKTHYTQYRDLGGFTFDRVADDVCNFTLDPKTIGTSRFVKTKCEKVDGTHNGSCLTNVYDDWRYDVVHDLCKIVVGGTTLTGGRQRVLYKGKIHDAMYGIRGGKYIVRGGGKIYLKDLKQLGGAYKGVSFLSESFMTFLSETIFNRLQELRPDLVSIQVFYDEMCELHRQGNRYIVLIYDFEGNTRNVFYIETQVALIACFADSRIKTGHVSTLTSEELQTHKQYFDHYVTNPVASN